MSSMLSPALRYPSPHSPSRAGDYSEQKNANTSEKMRGDRDAGRAGYVTTFPPVSDSVPSSSHYQQHPQHHPYDYAYRHGEQRGGAGERGRAAYAGSGYQSAAPGWSSWNSGNGYPATPPADPQAEEEGQGYYGQRYAYAQYQPAAQYPGWENWQYAPYQRPPPLTQHFATAGQHPSSAQQAAAVYMQQYGFNVQAPAFTPVNQRIESVAECLYSRFGVNKHNRSTQANFGANPVPVVTAQQQKGRKSKHAKKLEQLAASGQMGTAVEQMPGKTPKSKPIKTSKRPRPTAAYLLSATQAPQKMDISRPLLVVLDLNGTLLFRKKHGGSNAFIERPHVHKFLDYLFSNHLVMVWSSARPENVAKMCSQLFTKQQHDKLVAVWGRDKLNLTPAQYNQKCQVYKQLSWLWQDPSIQGKRPWSQENTVLIDDTSEKAASEPHNLVRIEEFEARPEQMQTDVLAQVAAYLDELRSQANVSAYIQSSPFRYVAPDGTVESVSSEDDESGDSAGGVSVTQLQRDW